MTYAERFRKRFKSQVVEKAYHGGEKTISRIETGSKQLKKGRRILARKQPTATPQSLDRSASSMRIRIEKAQKKYGYKPNINPVFLPSKRQS